MAQELLMINPRRRRRRLTKAKRAAAARKGWRRRKHRGFGSLVRSGARRKLRSRRRGPRVLVRVNRRKRRCRR